MLFDHFLNLCLFFKQCMQITVLRATREECAALRLALDLQKNRKLNELSRVKYNLAL